MLTKDLVRYKIDRKNKDQIIPQFIDTHKSNFISTANEMIEIFSKCIGKTRSEIQSALEPFLEQSYEQSLILKGFEKLLMDRCEFEEPNDEHKVYRQKVFAFSSSLVQKSIDQQIDETELDIKTLRNTYIDYRNTLAEDLKESPKTIGSNLYSDLPEYQKMVKFKPTTSHYLLNRYNSSTVQWLLLHSREITITLQDYDQADIRQLFKAIRFNQLLAFISQKENITTLTIDGPLNLFSQNKKYGMNLAMFFMTVLCQKKWTLQAQIEIRGKGKKELRLDSSYNLEPAYRQFLAYVPEEVKMFEALFKESDDIKWDISTANNFLQFPSLGSDSFCFPDFEFINKEDTSKKISMEIFHNWHAKIFLERIKQMDEIFTLLENKEVTDPPLILAINSKLAKDKSITPTIEQSQYFSKYGIIFNSMPTRNQVSKILLNF